MRRKREPGGCLRLLCAAATLLFGCSCPGESKTPKPIPAPTAVPTAQDKEPQISAGPGSDDPPVAKMLRKKLVQQITTMDKPWGGEERWDPRVVEALGKVPRHQFMPGAGLREAYQDVPHSIGYDQTISQPTVVALMTQALRLTGAERVLEIGTGSGYQAAVLSGLCAHVYSIEIVPPLARNATHRLSRLGYANVTVKSGDGYQGWPEHAPFDRVILTAAPPEMPAALVSQLRDGGSIVAPVGQVEQMLVRWTKKGDRLLKEQLGPVRFVPMVHGE